MKNVLKALHQHPIAVYPIYIDVTGSIAGGVLLSQLLYWIEKVDREIWKTDAEIIKETHLTQTEFKNAKKAIAALPFMSVAKKGTPPTTRYNVDWDKMHEYLDEMLSSVTYQLNRRLSTNKRGGNLPNKRVGNLPYNTESTSKTSSEITSEEFVEKEFSTPLLDADEIEDIEQQIFASKATQKKERKSVAPKKKESDNPAPIKPMFEIYSDQYAKMNGGEKPEFMPKYLQPMQKLYGILEARQIQSGIVPLDKLQPWRDFIEMWGKYLQDHPKETYFTANFNPATFYSQFNTIVAKLKNQPMTTAQKWEQFYRENTTG